MPSPDVIAFGRLRDDGAIELDMLAPHARLVYPPGHPQYFEIRHHLESRGGWLVPGKDRPVGPFPDEPVPVLRARMPGAVAREAGSAFAALPTADARREQDPFCAPDGSGLRVSYVAVNAARPPGEGLRIPVAVARTLAQAVALVIAEEANIADYEVDGRVTAPTVAVDLIPNLAPGEQPHPGGRTLLGPELHLTFDATTGALIKKLYAR